MKIFAVCALLFVGFVSTAQSPCDSQAEQRAENSAKACQSKKNKAVKSWSTLELAKKFIEDALRRQDIESLAPYIGCDAGDTSRLETLCEADQHKIDSAAVQKISKRLKPGSIQKSRWIQYGVKKDLFLLCSRDYGFVAAVNFCEETGKEQPVIEIRRSQAGYTISGVALSGNEL